MPILTVGQLNQYLKELVEDEPLLADIWLSGEVSNLSRSQAGHVYFTLKEADSQLGCVMFRSTNGGSELLAHGALVMAHGRVSFYPPRGRIDFIADMLMPEGTGPLYLELEKLKARLGAEGLFEASRKRPLPAFPRVVGVVTSPTGAAIQDICTVIERRYPLVEVLLAPALVQGEQAAGSIVAALRALDRDGRADVIIVARGGGSIEELWPFNEEVVARAMFACTIPVVSAVGHERDITIADLVADLRAPTPSAAAEAVVPDMVVLRRHVLTMAEMASSYTLTDLSNHRYQVGTLGYRLARALPDITMARRRTDELTLAVSRSLEHRLRLIRTQVDSLQSRLGSLDPRSILDRGYAIVEAQRSGRVVTSVSQVVPAEALRVTVSDGSFPAVARPQQPVSKHPKKDPARAGAPLF